MGDGLTKHIKSLAISWCTDIHIFITRFFTLLGATNTQPANQLILHDSFMARFSVTN